MLDSADVHSIYARSGGGVPGGPEGRPPAFKAVGISLAVGSGLFIGVSFVIKKVGLLKANAKYNEDPGEGMGYLKVWWWWVGMALMIIGEIFNFVAYAFVDAILVTPLGALSVVVTTILSAIFLKERLSFVGKVGCFNCIIGSVIIAMNAPTQSSVATIQDMQRFVISPGFLTWAGLIIVGCTFIALWAGPRYGNRSMFVYISICSLVGGLSVVATQGLGAAIISQIQGISQFKEWFLYVLLVFVIATLLTEIIYLNKALNIFNAALVTPTYYVFFTSSTIITSAILFQGFKGTAISITTIIMGFLQICSGVVLLQLSKSAKDVPDTAIFKGDLDQVREVAEQEQPETEPKADAIRGTAAIIRRISGARQRMEAEEARRYYEERRLDELEPPREGEVIEWDGLRRRRTIVGESPMSTPSRRATNRHPPLGMSKFPDFVDEELPHHRPSTKGSSKSSFFARSRTSSGLHPHWRPNHSSQGMHGAMSPVLTTITSETDEKSGSHSGMAEAQPSGSLEEAFQHNHRRNRSGTVQTIQWANSVKSGGSSNPHSPNRSSTLPANSPHHGPSRQFSFHNLFNRRMSNEPPHSGGGSRNMSENPTSPGNRLFGFANLSSRNTHNHHHHQNEQKRNMMREGTEEETLGLVKGDNAQLKGQRHLRDSSPSPTPTTPTFNEEAIQNDMLQVNYQQRPSRSPSSSSVSSTESSTEYKPHHTRVPSRDREAEAAATASSSSSSSKYPKTRHHHRRSSPPPSSQLPKYDGAIADIKPPSPPPHSHPTPHLPSHSTTFPTTATTAAAAAAQLRQHQPPHHPLPSLPTESHPRHPYAFPNTPERSLPTTSSTPPSSSSRTAPAPAGNTPTLPPPQLIPLPASSATSLASSLSAENERRERRERRMRQGRRGSSVAAASVAEQRRGNGRGKAGSDGGRDNDYDDI
ncbi:hypothetical protein RJZ56_001606 [Blastomyces dermatitidis]|uniref:DUF803 domain membrane protein n=1 Tax=Ajellomyces dermatitidis (strain ATCC 18188 / CBS 674.68) TaxID=653446 RepID=F2TUJ3_AJEDA|nr:DUF803 domain membrane protein [Blastomyces dermatitidis ATCC 18188]KMW69366.1 DUF803 domain membrane protein, variant 1 [Blastomyces dermatitidis ATCC 18188]KMW69367.1 DUF803 domain membrane protein, variant 2 [Blastomyces dermatitidis ATCC 18188]KMW69368.1 DUF803 domain membrane protein, variant 3 [Blastomyces dermatitidis ATCC 18188]